MGGGMFDDDTYDKENGFPTYKRDFDSALGYNINGFPEDRDIQDQESYNKEFNSIETERNDRTISGESNLFEDNTFGQRLRGRPQRAGNIFGKGSKGGIFGDNSEDGIFGQGDGGIFGGGGKKKGKGFFDGFRL
jgi:hypothetical protein